ncbi:MAG TPA: HD domain-containing phosphohydrolase [Planctomycetaceae bacterium]|nr:HD domain-containing phosphohydrolase [Planctomycetaceae bacterium]
MTTNSQTITFSIDRLYPGTTLGGPIYEDNDGSVLLLQAGVCVTEEQIEQLRNRGIQQIRIERRFADSVLRAPGARASRPRKAASTPAIKADKVAPPINRPAAKVTWSAQLSQSVQKLRGAQAEKLSNVYSLLENQGGFDAGVLDEIGQESIDQLSVDMDLFIKGSIEPQLSEAATEHCVRVSQLAVAVGAMAGHTREELRWLAMGCLVSRCRATDAARELCEAPRKLTAVEFAEIKRTPGRVFDMLSTIEFPLVARTVAYQIHERWNGSGYPRKKAGVQIHPLARIAGVCDSYVSLTSPRPHRPAFSLYNAVVQILSDARAGLFDPHTIRCFLRTVSLYPLGAYVRLNTGQIGRVLRTSPDAYDRPTIEIAGSTPPEIISLVDAPDILVTEVIDADQAAEEIFVPQEGQLTSEDINFLLGVKHA